LELDRAKRAIRGDWYDEDKQAYVPPRFDELRDHPVRKSGRLAGPGWDWQAPKWNMGWLRGVFTYLFTTVLVLILLACVVLLLTHFARSSRASEKKRTNKAMVLDLSRVEDLPFAAEQMQSDPLAQARRLADSGRFDQAIIYLYGYYLLALDHSRKIHLQKGKTNRMYLHEIHSIPNLRQIVASTMHKFEDAYFGKHPITAEAFEASWAELSQFHRLIQAEQPSKEDVDSADVVIAEAIT